MRASHLPKIINYLKYLCTTEYDGGELSQKSAKIIIDNQSAICMARCNKDTAENRYVARRFHYVRQGFIFKDHKVEGISSKFQLPDILTKVCNKSSFSHLWSLILHQED